MWQILRLFLAGLILGGIIGWLVFFQVIKSRPEEEPQDPTPLSSFIRSDYEEKKGQLCNVRTSATSYDWSLDESTVFSLRNNAAGRFMNLNGMEFNSYCKFLCDLYDDCAAFNMVMVQEGWGYSYCLMLNKVDFISDVPNLKGEYRYNGKTIRANPDYPLVDNCFIKTDRRPWRSDFA